MLGPGEQIPPYMQDIWLACSVGNTAAMNSCQEDSIKLNTVYRLYACPYTLVLHLFILQQIIRIEIANRKKQSEVQGQSWLRP